MKSAWEEAPKLKSPCLIVWVTLAVTITYKIMTCPLSPLSEILFYSCLPIEKKNSLKQDHGRAIRSTKILSQTCHRCHIWPQEIRSMPTDGMIPSIGFALRQICQKWLLKARKCGHGQIMTSARLIFVAAPAHSAWVEVSWARDMWSSKHCEI